MENKDKDLKLFELAMRKYTFQLKVDDDDDDDEEERRQQQQQKRISSTAEPSTKRVKFSHQSTSSSSSLPSSPPHPSAMLISSDSDHEEDDTNMNREVKKKKPTPLNFDKPKPYAICVTPEYLGDGLWTPGKLTDISANVVSYGFTREIDIDTLELPESCKILIHT